jgi:hypothetical protein
MRRLGALLAGSWLALVASLATADLGVNWPFQIGSGGNVVLPAPASGITLQATAASGVGNYAAKLIASNSAGNSFGLLLQAGAASNDYGLRVQNAAAADMFVVNGAGQILMGDGSAPTPAFSFFQGSNNSTGFYRSAANELSISNTGAQNVAFGASGGITIAAPTGGQKGAGTANLATGYYVNGQPTCVNATPTISSGFGTGPSVVSGTSPCSFQVNVGTGGAASSGVIALNFTASNGWACAVHDVTTPTTNLTDQTASSTTTVTVTNYVRTTGVAGAWTASDKLMMTCLPN